MNMKMWRAITLYLAVVPLLLSCNVYSPLNSNKSIEDHLQEAQKCLKDSDYGCAITQYNALPAGALKEEKLCLVHLAQGGITLATLINTINKNNSKMVGALAQALVPWTAGKSTSLDDAKTHCASFAADGTSGNQGTLLKSISLIAHCAIRITKTDLFLGNSESDSTCTTSGNGNGTIATGDIGPSGGSISSSSPGMCTTDVTTCVSDVAGLSSTALSTAGLGDLKTSIDAIPSDLKTTGAATAASRVAIQSIL